MKNYFNTTERSQHIILLCMEQVAKEFQESSALSEKEKEIIENISCLLQSFNESVYERFGEPYKRKVKGTLDCNVVSVVSKYSSVKDKCISYCPTEDLVGHIGDLINLNCVDCDKCDYKNCAVYGIAVACGVDGEDTNGCPYRW